MKTLLKIVLGLALALVVLVSGAALVATVVIDPNEYRGDIAQAVESKTGRKLSIDGNVELTFLPWLGLDVGRATLGNAPGFDAPNFASVERLMIRVKALPLLFRSVEMDTARIEGLKLHLARRADGTTNWADLADAKPADAPAGDPPAVAALALGGVEIVGAEVDWNDAVTGQAIRVSALSLSTGALNLEKPVPIEAQFDVAVRDPAISGPIRLSGAVNVGADAERITVDALNLVGTLQGAGVPGGTASLEVGTKLVFDRSAARLSLTSIVAKLDGLDLGTVQPTLALTGAFDADLVNQVLTASGLEVKTTLRGTAVPGGALDAMLKGSARFDLTSGQASAGGVELRIPAIDLDGTRGDAVIRTDLAADVNDGKYVLKGLVVKGELKGPKVLGGTLVYEIGADVTGDTQSERFRAIGLRAGGSLSGGDTPGKELPFAMAADALFDRRVDTLSLEGFKLSAADLKASGKLEVSAISTTPRLRGNLDVPAFDPRKVAALAGHTLPAMRDDKAFGSLTVNAGFDAAADSFKLDPLVLVVDGQTIKGSAAMPSIAAGSVRFALKADAFDADRYLPPKAKGATAAASPATAGAAAAGLPLDTLRGLDIDGRLAVGSLRVSNLSLSRVDAGVKAQGGLITIKPLDANLYGGSYRGHTVIDARGKQATVSVDEQIKGVQAEQLLKALGIKTDALALGGGKSSLSLAAKASGDTTTGRYVFDALKLNADIAGKSFPGGRLKAGVGADVKVDLSKDTLSADRMLIVFGELAVKGSLDVAALTGATPRYQAKLDVPKFNPRNLMKHLGRSVPAMADPTALTLASLRTEASGTARSIKLDKLDLELDGSTLRGNVDIKNLEPLVVDFDLDIDWLDLDRYAPPKSKAQAATPAAVATAVPVDLLRAIQANGALRTGKLKVGGIKMANVVLTAKAKDGRVKLHPLGARLYGGAYEGNVQIDATGREPVFSFSEQLSSVAVGDLLADLGKPQTAAGTLDASMALTTSGASTEALLARLGGDIKFALVRGAIGGIDIYQTICGQLDAQLPKIVAATRGIRSISSGGKLNLASILGGVIAGATSGQRETSAAQVAGRGYTPFDSLSATFDVKNGEATSRDFRLAAQDVRVDGAGSYTIPVNFLNFTARAALVRGCESSTRTRYAALAGKALPVQLKGAPPNIDINPQFDEIIEASLPALIAESDEIERQQAAQSGQQQQPATQPQKKDLGKELLKGILGGKGIGGLLSQ